MRWRRVLVILAVGLQCVLAVYWLHAGDTGKIAGVVLDATTGEPLVGANVTVSGSYLGGATDEKGEYFILQVPPGRWSVRASVIGYQSVVVENVQVVTDLTTRVDFALSSRVLELGREVSVVAERPLVQRDVTASVSTVTNEEILFLPNIQSVQDVTRILPGVVGLNVRGGRARETLYMVDGVPIANPRSGGYSGLEVPPDAIAELTMITGGFNAEYGQAQSGIVNIVTKDGSPKYSGGVLWRTDRMGLLGDDQNSDYAVLTFTGPEPVTRHLLPSLGIRIPGALHFFASADLDLTDTYVPNGETRSTFPVLGVRFSGRQDNRYSTNAKLTYRPTPNYKVSVSYRESAHQSDPYDHFWKLLPDRTLDENNEDNQLLISWTHTLNKITFYTLNLNKVLHRHYVRVNNMSPPDYPKRFEQVGDTNHDSFADTGFPQFWGEDGMDSWTLKFDLTSQVHPQHLVKAGLECTYYHLWETSISYPGWFFPGRDTIPGKWPEYGAIRVAYNVFPNMGSAYVQDKMEFEGLIANIGLRYDYWMPGRQIESPSYRREWEDRTGLRANIKKIKGHLSPRIGISYPIADHTVMYFAWGRFTQLPSLLHVYRDAYVGNFVGNPYDLDSEITSAYEIGFNHQLTKNMAFMMKGYVKDVSGLIGVKLAGHFGLPVLVYANKDYGTIRGFEFQLKRRYSSCLMGTVSYTLSWAMGRSSSPDQESSLLSVVPLPLRLRDYRLDWDQRHTLNLDLHVRAAEKMHLGLFGLKIPDRWGIDLLWRYGSGLPYTPPTRGGIIQPPYNTKTGPWNSTVDLRAEKGFNISRSEYMLFIEVLNLLGRRNPNQAFLNPATGKPYRFGDTTVRNLDDPDFRIFTWEEIRGLLNPLRVGPGRQVYLGLRVNW